MVGWDHDFTGGFILTKDLLEELRKDTDFQFVEESDVMHNKKKTELPILAINCILGGGLPLGCIVEGFGVPTSGKSSVLYHAMGLFQKKFEDGVSIIIDTESSIDATRMQYMGIDSDRLLRLPASTLEEGFSQLLKILQKKAQNEKLSKVPVFVIWDTIAIAATEAQVETLSAYGGGMAEKARLTKNYLSVMMPYVEKNNVLLVLLNQVMSKIGAFRPTTESGGGWGLKHDQHFQLEFKSGKTDYDGIFAVEKISSINITKSKLSSLFEGIPLVIDITKAGIVDEVKSFVEYAFNIGILNPGSWSSAPYLLERYPEESAKFPILSKSFRKESLINYCRESKPLLNLLQVAFIDMISEKYTYQAEICKSYRQELYEEVEQASAEPTTLNEDEGEVLEDED